tara:strand:- start:899 stop:1180 length:282 start_codon:yes stop_codon:yes gene_type:complete
MKDKSIKHDRRYWGMDRNGRKLNKVSKELMKQKMMSKKESEKQQLPDAKKHQIISFIKSGVRIVGYAFLPFSLVTATIILILSEIIGIIEELV